jgi:hypothetical protein
MNMKKPLLAAFAASIVTLGGVAGSGIVSAAASGGTSGSTSSLADEIASKFHLNKSDVQAVVDQHRAEHQAERQKKFEDRLDQAVTDGKLTGDQKDQILAKQTELKDYMDSIKDKSPQERHQLMKAKLGELKTWAKTNNIPPQYVRFAPGRPGK